MNEEIDEKSERNLKDLFLDLELMINGLLEMSRSMQPSETEFHRVLDTLLKARITAGV